MDASLFYKDALTFRHDVRERCKAIRQQCVTESYDIVKKLEHNAKIHDCLKYPDARHAHEDRGPNKRNDLQLQEAGEMKSCIVNCYMCQPNTL